MCLNHLFKRPSLKRETDDGKLFAGNYKKFSSNVSNLIYKYNITSELVVRHLDLQQLLMMLSREKAAKGIIGK